MYLLVFLYFVLKHEIFKDKPKSPKFYTIPAFAQEKN